MTATDKWPHGMRVPSQPWVRAERARIARRAEQALLEQLRGGNGQRSLDLWGKREAPAEEVQR